MNKNPIIIVWGEPNSIFSEILIKSLKSYKSQRPIILIGSKKLLDCQLLKLKMINDVNFNDLNFDKSMKLKKNMINLLNIDYKFNKPFEKISPKSNIYITKCFERAFQLLNQFKKADLINGPISKKYFLGKKYAGITEMLSHKFNRINKTCMLIYHQKLSVSPVTTHVPIEKIVDKLSKKNIIKSIKLINNFYKKIYSESPKIAICGLNPHCENFYKNKTEEELIIIPTIKYLKKNNFRINGPFSADTLFLEENRKKYHVIIGMYHDQVLTPIKTLYGFEPINITIGLPFIRISPDHGPNYEMIGKNQSNPQSLTNSIKFLNNLN